MPRITFSADAKVYQGNPHDYDEVKDPAVFKILHGLHSGDELCVDAIDQELVGDLGLSGGRVRFAFHEKTASFIVTTTYGAEQKPDKTQLQRLRDETLVQWSDGIGSGGFSNHAEEANSAALAMAMINENPDYLEVLGDYFVDASPDAGNNVKASWSDTGGPDDFLLNDLKAACNENDADAQAVLGMMYLEGNLARHDPQTGLTLLKRSAEQGNELGILHLALAYRDGTGGVEQDSEKAISWLEKGADAGSMIALAGLGETLKEGIGVAKDPDRALALLTQAAEAGFLPAIAELGDCYEFGHGTEINLGTAMELYEAALENGFDAVKPAIERIQSQL